MTPVGHTLTGLAIGIASMPKGWFPKKRMRHLLIFILLANVPDIPLPYWGHDQYRISHSVFVNFLLLGLVGFILWRQIRRFYFPVSARSVLLFFWVAWFSHFLLDSFYNHGLGVMIWWPFSDGSLRLPIAWFSVQNETWFPISKKTLMIWGVEAISFLPFVMLAVCIQSCKSGNWFPWRRKEEP